MSEPQACCACLTVHYRPIQHENGSMSERWVCAIDDSHEFVRKVSGEEQMRLVLMLGTLEARLGAATSLVTMLFIGVVALCAVIAGLVF